MKHSAGPRGPGCTRLEREVVARGIFTSVQDLSRKLMRYIRAYSKAARAFKWKHPKCEEVSSQANELATTSRWSKDQTEIGAFGPAVGILANYCRQVPSLGHDLVFGLSKHPGMPITIVAIP